MKLNKIYCGDNSEILKQIDNDSINCCVTPPPYWTLRDYEIEGQLGRESSLKEYINKLCNIFNEVKRVLRRDGTCWIVIGDTYNANYRGGGVDNASEKQISNRGTRSFMGTTGISTKSLVMIPFRFAIEMVNRGWILRNTIIWYKPNCMPSSVKDRFTVDFEYVFFFVKNKKYWFETQREPHTSTRWGGINDSKSKDGDYALPNYKPGVRSHKKDYHPEGRNKRCVWQIPTQSFKEAHFAVFPEELIEPMIKAGCPENGIVLDPFMGRGTTAIVAKKQGKNFVGIDINPKYCDMANKELANTYRQMELIK